MNSLLKFLQVAGDLLDFRFEFLNPGFFVFAHIAADTENEQRRYEVLFHDSDRGVGNIG